MTEEKDLSSYASFDVDDIVSEISSRKKPQKEVTAYLDRSFLVNMINEHNRQEKQNKIDFSIDKQINIREYNFSGADFKNIKEKYFELFNFYDCDISLVRLDRIGINFFRKYMIDGNIIFQGINLEGAYLGPVLSYNAELGIKCYMYLNLSNIDLTGSNFHNCNITGLILENTNISSCNFINVKGLDPQQFAFTTGFESAFFSEDDKVNQAIKEKIKHYSLTLDSVEFYAHLAPKPGKLMAYLADFTNFLDD